jgi:hypothetical protein
MFLPLLLAGALGWESRREQSARRERSPLDLSQTQAATVPY